MGVTRRELSVLARWLMRELSKRNLSAREAALNAGLNHGAISRYLSGKMPSIQAARKLAAYFEVPDSYVLELAGHVKPTPEHSQYEVQLVELTRGMTDEQKETLLDLARSMKQRNEGQR